MHIKINVAVAAKKKSYRLLSQSMFSHYLDGQKFLMQQIKCLKNGEREKKKATRQCSPLSFHCSRKVPGSTPAKNTPGVRVLERVNA